MVGQQKDSTRHIRARSRFEISIPPEICTISNHGSLRPVGQYIRHPIDRLDSSIESENFGSFDDGFDDDAVDNDYHRESLNIDTVPNRRNIMESNEKSILPVVNSIMDIYH
jgi:hypothetical protein